MLEAAVDRFGLAVVGAGSVQEREHIGDALLQRSAKAANLIECRGEAVDDGVDHCSHHPHARGPDGCAVGRDDALVDAPGMNKGLR